MTTMQIVAQCCRSACSPVALGIALALAAGFLASAAEPGADGGDLAGSDLSPGSTVSWSHPTYRAPLELWLPENYSTDLSWPVMLFFHGTNGQPATRLMRHYTGGRDFVVVGMSYLQQGQFQHSPEGLDAEIKAYREVLEDLLKSVNVDRRRIYVAGISKGGWLSGLFLEKDRQLAGGMVLGGGVFDRADQSQDPFAAPIPIYVGIGANDGNLGMSYKARLHFSELKAKVTLDVWPGLGHSYPLGEHESVGFRQWLMIEAQKTDGVVGQELRDEAIEWFEEELRKIRQLGPTVDAWLELDRLAIMPYASLIDDAARARAREILKTLGADPKVSVEERLKARYWKIIHDEIVDLTIERLATCASAYKALWAEHPETHFGDLAQQSYERTQKMLRSVPASALE